MKTKAWLAAALMLGILCVTGCDVAGDSAEADAGSCGVAVLGPTPAPETLVPKMIVRRGFTDIAHNSTYDIGARGWSVAGPVVDFQVINNSRGTIVLDTNPAAVVVSGASNATIVSLSQPSTVIPAGESRSFDIVFEVDARGEFEFAVSISNHGAFSSDFFFVVSGEGKEQLGFTKAIANNTDYGVFTTGVAQDNPQQRHTNLDNAKGTKFSPNGRFGAAVIGGHAAVFSTATGNSVNIIETVYNQFNGEQFSWTTGANGLQYLAILDKESYEAAPHLYTCIVSGSGSPQVTGLAQVSLLNAPAYPYRLAEATWGANGTRLAFHLSRVPYNPSDPGFIWAAAVNNGTPGQATAMASVPAYWGFNRFEWANAQSAGDRLVFQQTSQASNIRALSVSVSGSVLAPGAETTIGVNAWRWNISPNGNRIAYVQGVGPGQTDSYPYAYSFATGGDPVLLQTISVPGNFNRVVYATPTWSPDGKVVAFSGTYSIADRIDMYAQRLTSAGGAIALSGGTLLLSAGLSGISISELKFSPESQRLVFQTSDYAYPTVHQQLCIASIENNPVVKVVHDTYRPNAHHYFFQDITFSPRGDSFAFIHRAPQNYPNWHLMVVTLSGARFLTASAPYDATGVLVGFGLEKYQWLR